MLDLQEKKPRKLSKAQAAKKLRSGSTNVAKA